MVRLLRSISLKRLVEHPLRSLITIFGISLGTAVLVAVVLVNATVL